jgi:hypothetical protein
MHLIIFALRCVPSLGRNVRGSLDSAKNPPTEYEMRDAGDIMIDGVATRVFSAEHLAAIALQTGRSKDKLRVLQFVESGVLNSDRLTSIISRNGLTEQWALFTQQFLDR